MLDRRRGAAGPPGAHRCGARSGGSTRSPMGERRRGRRALDPAAVPSWCWRSAPVSALHEGAALPSCHAVRRRRAARLRCAPREGSRRLWCGADRCTGEFASGRRGGALPPRRAGRAGEGRSAVQGASVPDLRDRRRGGCGAALSDAGAGREPRAKRLATCSPRAALGRHRPTPIAPRGSGLLPGRVNLLSPAEVKARSRRPGRRERGGGPALRASPSGPTIVVDGISARVGRRSGGRVRGRVLPRCSRRPARRATGAWRRRPLLRKSRLRGR
ncbi:hypothetical protein AMPC_38220 [Anaeromyxobacter paludicola]|uniref:LigA n=1 Tax=Anaeromyxobacter paludicola TaxID=2918171 RepID=A0ABM7XFM7_9BACT|nr:hypothetical protein AMPC_38220 [Anaeromyxobacter paludicola]